MLLSLTLLVRCSSSKTTLRTRRVACCVFSAEGDAESFIAEVAVATFVAFYATLLLLLLLLFMSIVFVLRIAVEPALWTSSAKPANLLSLLPTYILFFYNCYCCYG